MTDIEERLAAVEAQAERLMELLRIARRRIEAMETGLTMAKALVTSTLENDPASDDAEEAKR